MEENPSLGRNGEAVSRERGAQVETVTDENSTHELPPADVFSGVDSDWVSAISTPRADVSKPAVGGFKQAVHVSQPAVGGLEQAVGGSPLNGGFEQAVEVAQTEGRWNQRMGRFSRRSMEPRLDME